MLVHNVHAHSKNAGLLLVPVWARKRSQLYHNQDTMLRSLGVNTCDFSQQASILAVCVDIVDQQSVLCLLIQSIACRGAHQFRTVRQTMRGYCTLRSPP